MKKHRSHESSFNKESASHNRASTPSHFENELIKRKGLESEHRKATDSEAKLKEHKEHPKKERSQKKKPEKEQATTEDVEAKEEKRTEIVEKSLALKKHFEDTPIPKDAHLVARLVIAEHIIALHEQIEDPQSHESDLSPDKLVAALDYMGELAEKLEDPSAEVEPNIQKAYEELVELTEQALEAEAPEGIIQRAGNETTIVEQASQKASDAIIANSEEETKRIKRAKNQHKSPLAAVILAGTLAQLRQDTPSPDSSTDATASPPPRTSLLHHGGGSSSSSESPLRETTQNIASDTVPSSPHLNHLSPAEARTQYLHAVAQEHRMSRPLISSAAPIAAIAITSALRSPPTERLAPSVHSTSIAEEQSSSPLHEYSVFAPPPSLNKASIPATIPLSFETSSFKPMSTSHEGPSFASSVPFESTSRGSKKLEHLPLQTLLTMAEGLAIGHGRYLRREFEQNHIDREGLVKVLKARAKGQDYTMEYRHQTKRFRLAKTSPEFLHTSQPQDKDTNSKTESAPQQEFSDHALQDHTKLPVVPHPFMSVNETAAPLMTPRPETTKNSSLKWISIVLIASVLLVIILVTVFVL